MKKDESFHSYVMEELFRGFDGITSRAMFGGWGIYKNGLFFALIDNGQLYFKVDETNKIDFESKGSKQFTYQMRGGKVTRLNFWELPAEAFDNAVKLKKLLDSSVAVARKVKNKNELFKIRD